MLTDELKITNVPTISDELLNKMIGYLRGFPLNGYAEVGVNDVLIALQELLLSRQQLKELEDKYDKLHGLSVYWEKDEAKKNLEIDCLKTEIGEWEGLCKKYYDWPNGIPMIKHDREYEALLEKYGKA